MYEAVPAAAAAWRALFTRVFEDLALDIRIVEHRFPQPIDTLWADPGLCCAFMCGWPFTRSTSGMQAIAAPVPSPPRYQGLPRYCSDFVARAESGFERLEDAFGYRFGWMAENSHSGFNAPRAHLARFVTAERRTLFGASVGPLGNPAKTLEALRARSADLVAVDGFYLDLLRRHDAARLEGLSVIGSTAWMPIPLLVAAPGIDPAVVSGLREHLVRVHELAHYADLLEPVLVSRFATPDVASYRQTEALREHAERLGYTQIR
jgi:ABC-type phosphate/phosphonate transport system substrate-binding protein